MVTSAEETALRITARITPIVASVTQGGEALVVQARIREEVGRIVAEMQAERRAAMSAQHDRMTAASAVALANQRAADAATLTNADQVKAAAVAAARADEQSKCATLRAQDAAAATTAQNNAVAAAKSSTRTLILTEIQSAPVTGLLPALLTAITTTRAQIKAYVAAGPY